MQIEKTLNKTVLVADHSSHSAPDGSSHAEEINNVANGFYSRMQALPAPAIRLDLKGRAAGQWRLSNDMEILRFNPEAFRRDWHAHFPATVAHEVAHSLVYRRFGIGSVRPHGPEWRALMRELGFPPTVTHRTPLRGRRTRVYLYLCSCQLHPLGPRQHSLVLKGSHCYTCTHCGYPLRFQNRVEWRREHV